MLDARLRKFAIQHQVNANRMQLQAQQSPSDKFWTIVCWLYNVGYDTPYFNPSNEFGAIHPKVEHIDPAAKDQYLDVEDLQKKWGDIKKRMN